MARNDLQQLVDAMSTIDPELGKELLYSLERGFIEDKPTAPKKNVPANLLGRDDNRKSGAALTVKTNGDTNHHKNCNWFDLSKE